MLPDPIPDYEYLYRRVIINPNFWHTLTNRPTSAIFKDSKGVSVDRDGGRIENEVLESVPKENIRAVVKILTKDCRTLNTYPLYNPLPENEYHSLILDSPNEINIKNSKAKKLRDKSINCIVY